MLARFGIGLASVLIAANLALAQVSTVGGLPANPSFDAVTVSDDAPQIDMVETDAAADNQRWRCTLLAEVFRCQFVSDAGATNSWLAVERTANTGDSINLLATNVQVNGESILKYAAGQWSTSGTTCVPFSNNNYNVTCTRNAAGDYTVNVSGAGFTNNPKCVATYTAIAGTPRFAMIASNPNVVSLDVELYSLAGNLTDGGFSIHCVGE